MSSSSPPASPSHRSPLTLLSKLKRQLSKSPVTQLEHQKQPIEHQYLPIPSVSFSESLHSNQALSTYSCSNNSSSTTSFLLIDHNEQPASFGVDEYRPFLPLIIQHERLQQQQQRLAQTRPPPASGHRARIIHPPPTEPPSPTSTASSKSPITPIFPSSSFFDDGDDDDIMTMSNSELGSISEYSLPRSLSAYVNEARSRRGRKSGCQTSSDSESRHRRSRGMSIRAPPQCITSRKSFPPISPPPSCPLPEPPLSVVKPTSTAISPKTPIVTSDGESLSSHASLRNELKVSPSIPLVPASSSSSLSPAIISNKTKAKPARPESTATILSDLEIFDSPTYAFTTSDEQPSDNNQKEDEVDDDDASPSTSTRTSVSTPTTPRQYGIGRQVLSGSGSGRDFDFIGSSSKRLSTSAKRDSIGLEKRGSRLSFGPAELTLNSKAEKTGNVEQQLDSPPHSVTAEGSSQANQDDLSTQPQTRPQIPTPTPRRRVKSDDTNRNAGANVSRRSTTYHEKNRDNSHPEWTLFLGIPRNAAPPPPPPQPVPSVLLSTGESNAVLASSTITPARTITQRHSLLTTHFLTPTMMTMRNRTRSDSALLLSASASAFATGVAAEEEHDDDDDDDDGKRSKVTKTKRGEEDWTLSLPLVVSPTTPSSVSSVEVLRGSKQHSDVPSGSQPAVVVEEGEERQPRVVGDLDANQDLVITVENEEEKVEEKGVQDPLILRVPRIVRSCSSYPILSTTSASHDIHSRLKKSSSTKWMGMETTTTSSSTPNLRRGVSSCTLEEEVMSMLLDDSATAEEEDDDNKSQSKLPSLTTTTTTTKKDLEKKKMATLDEDLARFNALLKNGNMNGATSRPVSLIIENAVAAAAAASAAAAAAAVAATTSASAPPTKTKTKTVTLNSHPEPIPTTTNLNSVPPSLRKKNKSTSSLKPALKHVKSCEPFLLLEKSSLEKSSSSDGSSGPVMRFPSSAGRGGLNFFDELGRSGGGGHGKRGRASLRLTKSAEWVTGNENEARASRLPPPPPVPTTVITTTKSRPTSSSSRLSQQQQQRTTTTSMSRPTSSSSRMSQSQQQRTTTPMSRPTSASSRMSQSQQQRTTTPMSRPTSSSSRMSQQQRTTSRSNSPLSTSTTQTPLLLPFAHYNTKFASSSSSSSASTTTTTNLKSKGSLGRFEMSGRRGGVPTMPFRAVSMGSMSSGTTNTTTTTIAAPVESTSGFSTSQKEKQQQQPQQQHRRKRSPPAQLPLHSPNSSSSSSASAASLTSTSSTQKRHISFRIDSDNTNNNNNNDSRRRRSVSPPPPPSPIPSESSSTLPTPLASAFPLPPSSPGISISELDGAVSIQQKLREFENERGRLQQQQQRKQKQQYQSYKPPSSVSSLNSMVSIASSTSTIVPSASGDQKKVTNTAGVDGGVARDRAGEEEVQEEDEDSMCSSMYYTARSSFSHERHGIPGS